MSVGNSAFSKYRLIVIVIALVFMVTGLSVFIANTELKEEVSVFEFVDRAFQIVYGATVFLVFSSRRLTDKESMLLTILQIYISVSGISIVFKEPFFVDYIFLRFLVAMGYILIGISIIQWLKLGIKNTS